MPYWVYIMTNISGTLYTGVTNDLTRRLHQHRTGSGSRFASQYHIDKLVYCEETGNVLDAIAREKEIKSWRREKKVRLINSVNPKWEDLVP
ncbi:MAG TPA: GIY-YIG nuclease family protein [candidate division Zixibacteria bacterium]|jgi:putative endonuclease